MVGGPSLAMNSSLSLEMECITGSRAGYRLTDFTETYRHKEKHEYYVVFCLTGVNDILLVTRLGVSLV